MHFHVNFRITFSISGDKKPTQDFHRGRFESAYQLSIAAIIILSGVRECGMAFHSFRSFLTSFSIVL